MLNGIAVIGQIAKSGIFDEYNDDERSDGASPPFLNAPINLY